MREEQSPYLMGNRLSEKVAIVTGASSGIGKEIVKLFVCEGANVIAVSRSLNDKFLCDIKCDLSSIADAENRIHIFPCDVSDEIQVKSVVENSLKRLGNIDILINAAGITNRASVINSDFASWREVISVNLSGTFLFSHYVVQNMIKNQKGNIIFVSSIGAYMSWLEDAAYQTTKGGLTSLCRSMAVDLAEHNIRVNCVCPGLIDAPMLAGFLESNDKDGAILRRFKDRIPLKRLGKTIEVAKSVLFLASEDSSYITGTSLVVDGGYTVYDN